MRHLAALLSVLSVIFASSVAFAAYQVYTDAKVAPCESFFIRGNTSGAESYNVSINVTGGNNGTTLSSGGGYFSINVTAPCTVGEHNITVTSNNDSLTKPAKIFVSNLSSNFSSITFTRDKPPFSAGKSFTINITMKNSTNHYQQNYTPYIEVYSANGQKQTSWTIANMSNDTDHKGWLEYNITIPSGIDGEHVISVDRGNIVSIVIIKSNYVMAISTQTSSNETKFDYTPSASFNIVAKIRDTDGQPIGNAVNTTAKVTKPDGTVDSVNLDNDTTVFGQYKGSYTLGSSLGQHTIRVTGIVGTTTIESSTIINVLNIKAIFDTQKEFFREWGDSSAFVPGGTIGLVVVATNLSNSIIFSGYKTTYAGDAVNCTKVADTLQIFYLNGTKYVLSTAITNDTSGTYLGQSVCRVQFAGPSETGTYKITANVSINLGNYTTLATGYFAVQRFVLKPSPVSSLGGSFDFMTMLHPGENVTFDLGAYDLANNSEVAGLNITNITITKIIPLEFNAGSSDITSGAAQRADAFNLTNITAGSNTKNPTVTLGIPVNKTGPFLIEMQAIIDTAEGHETVTGRGFYIAKYIMGFMSSQGKTDASFSGPSGGFGGFSSCSEGTERFSGSVRELKTNTAPKDPVTFNSILQAREEFTGKDISSCLTMTTNSSDSSGSVSVSVTFNRTKSGCESMSGFHFMLFNVTYQGKEDQVPAGFMCRQYSFFPQTRDSSGNWVWRIDTRGSINFTLDSTNNVRRLNDSATMYNGTLTLVRAYTYSPSSGMSILVLNSSANLSATVSNQVTSLIVSPSTFSKEKFPNGFVSITWKFAPNGSEGSGSDTTESGFQVSAFDAYIMNTERPTTGGSCGAGVTCLTNGSGGGYGGFGSTFRAGDDIIMWLRATTNVSKANNTYGGTNTTGGTLIGVQSVTGFTAKVGLPWEGKLKPVSINNATLVIDGWNGSYDNEYPNWGAELWRLNITIPSTLKKGFQALQIEVNSSANDNSSDKVTTDVWFSVVKYSVVIGQEAGMTFESSYQKWGNYSTGIAGTGGSTIAGESMGNTTIFNKGFNLTFINTTYNLRSKSDSVCARNDINVTIWSNSSTPINYTQRVGILVLDNKTAGIYDTIIINSSTTLNYSLIMMDGPQNLSSLKALNGVTYNMSRNITANLYLWDILDCSYVRWIDVSYIPSSIGSWGGQYEKRTNFTIPYIVKRGSSTGPAITGASVSLNAVIKQNDAAQTSSGASGGSGFSKKLTSSDYYSAAALTDANGLAFVPVNISGSTGSFMLFWKVNESSGQEDVASFQSEGFGGYGGGSASGDIGTQIQIRAFDAHGTRIGRVNDTHANIAIKLTNITSPSDGTITIYGINWGGANAVAYNATWNEAVGGQLVQNNALDNYTILFNFTASQYGPNATIIGNNTADLTTASVDTSFKYAGSSVGGRVLIPSAIRNTDGQNVTIAWFDESPGSYSPILNVSQNISIKVCAQTYTKPQKPVLGANVYIFAESWGSTGGGYSTTSTQEPLMWFDPINGTPYLFGPISGRSEAVANATVGPQGCVALDVVRPAGWGAYTSYQIKAKVKRTSAADNETDTEETYADSVWRSPQCSNGVDDDGDGGIDYISWGNSTTSDLQCSSYSDDSETN